MHTVDQQTLDSLAANIKKMQKKLQTINEMERLQERFQEQDLLAAQKQRLAQERGRELSALVSRYEQIIIAQGEESKEAKDFFIGLFNAHNAFKAITAEYAAVVDRCGELAALMKTTVYLAELADK
jgi:ABC-type hemin transport system substrate-binding protein